MQQQLNNIATTHSAAFSPASLLPLIDFIERIRPHDLENHAMAESLLMDEVVAFHKNPMAAQQLADSFWALFDCSCQAGLYAESGLSSGRGFALELTERITSRLLPASPDFQQLRGVLNVLIDRNDAHWLCNISDDVWYKFIQLIQDRPGNETLQQYALSGVVEAIRMISYQIAGTSLDREILRAQPDLERFESPFLAQNADLLTWLATHQSTAKELGENAELDFKHMQVLLQQCQQVISRIRRKATETGISLRLTYLLARLDKLIERMLLLLTFLFSSNRGAVIVPLIKTLIDGEKNRHEAKQFIKETMNLVARNVTDNASRHGEHYIATTRSEWLSMFYSACGGGAIIAFMSFCKILISTFNFPPLTDSFLNGTNYALGFLVIYLLGFTVATKQPAMTATVIAATLQDRRPNDIGRLVDLVQQVIRTQFIAILGNVLVAFTLAFSVAWLWQWATGGISVSEDKAHHLIDELHPYFTAAIFYAAVAGVGLFLSGLVAGFFDNWARYHGLQERIVYSRSLARYFSYKKLQGIAKYLDERFGAIMGNLFIGYYLGLAGSISKLTGLPIEVRHVTLSSANLAIALEKVGSHMSASMIAAPIIGIAFIGLFNLIVSFSLALYVAMISCNVPLPQITNLIKEVFKLMVRRPWDFVRPPKKGDYSVDKEHH